MSAGGILSTLRRVTLCAVVLVPTLASAQSRLSLEGFAAPVVPLGTVVDTLAVRSEQIEGRGTPGLSSLVDRRGAVGVRVGVRVVSGRLEAGYSFTYLPLGSTREICRGATPVATLPDGTIEDAAVSYACVPWRRAPEITLLDDRTGLRVHALDGGVRLGLFGQRINAGAVPVADAGSGANPDRFGGYAVFGGGPRLATAAEVAPERRLRFGVGLSVGVGLEARIAPRIRVVADARYGFDVLMTSGSPSRNADRAVAADRGVLGALSDLLHVVQGSLGVRVDLR